MTKKDYYNLLAQENLVKKVETTADDPNAFEHKVYKTSGGSENKLFRYDCDLTDEELNRAIQLKQLAKLNTIAHIMIFTLIVSIIAALFSVIN